MELWQEGTKVFLNALQEFQKRKEGGITTILPIHGSKLGGVEWNSKYENFEDAESLERERREKALYNLKSTALPMLKEAIQQLRNSEFKKEFELFEQVAMNIDLETSNETLSMYHAILSVHPFLPITEIKI